MLHHKHTFASNALLDFFIRARFVDIKKLFSKNIYFVAKRNKHEINRTCSMYSSENLNQHRRQNILISMFLSHILLSQACARTSNDEIFNKAFTLSAFSLFIITFINSIFSIFINLMQLVFTFRSCHICLFLRLSFRLHLSFWSFHHIFDVLDSYIVLFTCSNKSHHHHLAFTLRMWRVSHFMSYRYDFVFEEALDSWL